MKRLEISEKERISYLISGINNLSLRSNTTPMRCQSVSDLLTRVQEVAARCADYWQNFSQSNREAVKNRPNSPKSPEVTKSEKDLFCAYCRKKGHTKEKCFRLKKKEQAKGSQPRVPMSSSSTIAASTVAIIQEVKPKDKNVLLEADDRLGFSKNFPMSCSLNVQWYPLFSFLTSKKSYFFMKLFLLYSLGSIVPRYRTILHFSLYKFIIRYCSWSTALN